MAGVAVMTAVAVAGFAVAIYAAWLFHDMPDGSELADFHPTTSARVFAWDGTLIGEYGQERRIYVPYNRIPPQLAEAFLAAVRPRVAIISVGRHNHFGHPAPETLTRLEARGASIVRTDRCGAITIVPGASPATMVACGD